MSEQGERLYLIQRESSEVSKPGDVYVTGPHFGTPDAPEIFSSTHKAAEASRYTMQEATDLLARGNWRTGNPRFVAVEDAEDLPHA